MGGRREEKSLDSILTEKARGGRDSSDLLRSSETSFPTSTNHFYPGIIFYVSAVKNRGKREGSRRSNKIKKTLEKNI